MQSIQEYNDFDMNATANSDRGIVTMSSNDSMQVDGDGSINPNPNSGLDSENERPSPFFRTNSLFLASFPWFTTLPMIDSKLADPLQGEERYGFHLAQALDNYDSFLESQNIHNSQLKAILRNVNADSMADMSSTAISKREGSMLRSKEKANEFCSLLCGYRLLDVIVGLVAYSDESTQPPVHNKMGINISKNDRALRLLGNWTGILGKFQHNFTSSKAKPASNIATSDLPTRQLQALFQLHSNMTVEKSLINMQLAATHISFMLQQRSEENVIPDFPATLQDFKALVLKIPTLANDDEADRFSAFLERLAGDKHQIDNLRLPLQMALLISPIFLLQDAQIHLSTFYSQRYKMALYSKALGNRRPRIISEIENVIWNQILNVALGIQTVYDAAANIIQHIPETFDNIDLETRNSIDKKEDYINLSSFHIEKGSIPEKWPLATLLQGGSSFNLQQQSMESDEVAPLQKKRSRKIISIPSTSSAKPDKKNIRHSKSNSKISRRSLVSKEQTPIAATRELPLVMGNTYLKVENFDLEELSTLKLNSEKYVPLSENIPISAQFSTYFHTFNIHGTRLEHMLATPFKNIHTATNSVLKRIEGKFSQGEHVLRDDHRQMLAIKAISLETVRDMSPQSFQIELRSKHIVIPDYNLSPISCDRRGIMSLNSLKDVVDIENSPQLKEGILKQFVENSELNNPNTLRIVRMRSYSGVDSSLFSSEHVAWRETLLNPYCVYDSSGESSLRWTDISTVHAVQFWRIAPEGFGIFFDIRCGQQLIIIATANYESEGEEGNEFFMRWGHHLHEFDQLDPTLFSGYVFEAIRLEPGNRLILRPNTPYIVLSLEDTIVTGGFYLSSHSLFETLMGRIHSFILPSLLSEGRKPPLTIFIRRIIHYMHNSYVLNDSSDRSHLLRFSTLDDARDLLSLVALAFFLNILDERTYQLSTEAYQDNPVALQQCHETFDLNAIPVIERFHLCYTRGLALDLLEWFFENYSFSSVELEEDDIDAFPVIFIPFIVHIGRQIAKYKRVAEEHGNTKSSSFYQVNRQVQYVLFSLAGGRDVWLEEKAVEEENDYCQDMEEDEAVERGSNDLTFDLGDYIVSQRDMPMKRRICSTFLEDGKCYGDERFFRGLTSQFDLGNPEALQEDDFEYFSS